MKLAISIACVLFGCGTTDIDRDVCGNGIVEVGEDCDSDDPRCEACGVTCESGATEECLAYDPEGMAGFVCGPDYVCHAPAGRFEFPISIAMPAENLRVTDVNDDRVGDLLVQSQTSVTAVFDAATSGVTQATLQTPIARGKVAFARIDEDTSLDALLPTTDGIVAFTTRFGVPSPYPFPSPIEPSMGVPMFVHAIRGKQDHLGIVGFFPDLNDTLIYGVMDVSQQPPAFIGQADLCGGKVGDLDSVDLEVFDTQPQHAVVAVTLRPPGEPTRLCVVTVDFTGAAYAITALDVPNADPRSRPVLTNLRGQICPSLLVARGDAQQVVEYKPTQSTDPCGFETSPTIVVGVPAGIVPVGAVPLSPPLGPPLQTHQQALVLSSGIFVVNIGTQLSLDPSPLYQSDRLLHRVQVADIDGDGDIDAVASGNNSEDLDILDRKPNGYLRFRFDTAASVGQFLLGDFDGNERPDIAYIERGLGEERLQIAYGTSDQFLAGVNVGTFTQILAVVPTSIPDSTDPTGLIADLAVLFIAPVFDGNESTLQPAISLLHGSPQRTMLAFFDPRDPPPHPSSQFRAVVAGAFSGSGSNGNDVLAVEQVNGALHLHLSTGAVNGELQSQAANELDNIADCQSVTDPTTNGDALCINDAHFFAWAVGDNHDVVLAIDDRREIGFFDPRLAQVGQKVTMTMWPPAIAAPVGAVVRKIQRVVVGDGSPRLLVSLASPFSADRTVGAVNLCTLDLGTGPVCEDLSARVSAEFGQQICIDGAQARVASASRFQPPDTSSPDLVLLCRGEQAADALYRLSFHGDDIRVNQIDFVVGDSLEAGDLSGDGIDDIVVLQRNAVTPVMSVYRQCNSRETQCGLAAASGEGIRE